MHISTRPVGRLNHMKHQTEYHDTNSKILLTEHQQNSVYLIQDIEINVQYGYIKLKERKMTHPSCSAVRPPD